MRRFLIGLLEEIRGSLRTPLLLTILRQGLIIVEYRITMLKKVGKKYVVFDSTGENRLGSHATREKALKQLAAIEISKKKQKG